MRVALIHFRLLLKGGLESRMFNYIRAFREQGHEVTVIYSKKAKEVQLPEDVKEIKIPLGLGLKKYRTTKFSKKLQEVLANEKFDLSLSMGRTADQNLVIAPCTHYGNMAAEGKTEEGPKDKIEINLDNMAYASSDKILACSAMVKDEIIKYHGIDPSKIEVLFPPLNDSMYFRSSEDDQAKLKKKHGLDPNKISFLFVSSSHKRKGLPLLSKVFSQLDSDHYELGVVGDRIGIGHPANVKSLGFYEDLRELYVAADFTIHPAVYEPFGQIISESIRCETPVLVSSNTGAKEIVNDSNGLVIDSQDVAVWKEAILNLDASQFHITADDLKGKGIYLKEHVKMMLELAGQ